jgi:hypothetical protein
MAEGPTPFKARQAEIITYDDCDVMPWTAPTRPVRTCKMIREEALQRWINGEELPIRLSPEDSRIVLSSPDPGVLYVTPKKKRTGMRSPIRVRLTYCRRRQNIWGSSDESRFGSQTGWSIACNSN